MKIILVTVPAGCSPGDTIAVNTETGDSARIQFQHNSTSPGQIPWPIQFMPRVSYNPQSTPPPMAPRQEPISTTVKAGKQILHKRPTDRVKRDRELLISKVAAYPNGIQTKAIAMEIYGKNVAKHEKQYVYDDAVFLVRNGLFVNFSDEYGQYCVKPAPKA